MAPENQGERRLGQILVDRGVIAEKQLEEAMREQTVSGRFFGEILVSRGAASEEQIARSLSEQLGIAFVDVTQMTIEPKAIELIPRDFCLQNTALPILISQNMLTVAMANALDVQAVDKLQSLTGLRIRPVFACSTAIRTAIDKQFGSKNSGTASSSAGISFEKMSRGAAIVQPGDSLSSLKQAANWAPVIERVNQLIEKAVEMGASDIHLEPERNKFTCRFRVDGVLQTLPPIPFEEQAAVISRVKIMADMDIAEKRLPQDGRVRTPVAGHEVDLRISTFPSIYGENLVIRILDQSGGLLKLSDLGFSNETRENFSRLIHRPYGLMLVTGPTGSGKTTTIYSGLSEINSVQKNIITLEDPVEYELPNIRQSQINVKAGLTFASGLRSIVRQDPDIIMIGEIRDKETAEIAIHAALTGHLVLSTLHTNDAPSAAARLIDMGVEPFLVASSIIGILAQRLMRTLCPACKEKYTAPKELITKLNLPKSVEHLYKENGCPKCKQIGYAKRTGIYELLIPTERLKELIAKKSTASVITEEAVKSGMKTLRDAGVEKVAAGSSSVSELLRVTEETWDE